jgi:hypothetical protein
MTIPQENQVQATEQKISDKELNFRTLQAKYEKQLEHERLEKERLARELEQTRMQRADDDDDDDDYVKPKKLEKKLNQFGQQTMQQTQAEIQRAVHTALEKEREKAWLDNNKDFNEVMKPEVLQKFMDQKPGLVQSILAMPDSFERQKLVYSTIKSLGIDKPVPKEPSIQDKIDANRRTPYYQPSGIGSAPYSQVGDFSEQGKKQAYEKMKELKARLRI